MKDGNIIKWNDSNGNMCFRFTERQAFERPWIIILVAILLLAMVGVEYMLDGSGYLLIPAVHKHESEGEGYRGGSQRIA